MPGSIIGTGTCRVCGKATTLRRGVTTLYCNSLCGDGHRRRMATVRRRAARVKAKRLRHALTVVNATIRDHPDLARPLARILKLTIGGVSHED